MKRFYVVPAEADELGLKNPEFKTRSEAEAKRDEWNKEFPGHKVLEIEEADKSGRIAYKESSEIAAHDGLLYRDGQVIDLPEADSVARSRGYPYAELLADAMQEATGTPSKHDVALDYRYCANCGRHCGHKPGADQCVICDAAAKMVEKRSVLKGIPYSVLEARDVARHHRMDEYHREIIVFLCDLVDDLERQLAESKP